MKLFVGLGRYYMGYYKKDVTPYMHIMVYHVPEMISHYGKIKKFSGQGMKYYKRKQFHVFIDDVTGVEKNNDAAKKNYFSSNKHDAPGEILKTEARLEALRRGIPISF